MSRLACLSILGALSLLACTVSKQPHRSAPSLPPEVQVPPTTAREALAWFDAFVPRVNFRRSRELVWQDPTQGQSLFAYDAVQTHASASARLSLKNGSELTLSEDTLVIINPSGIRTMAARDKAVVRAGQLKGRTTHELWVLTSGALFRFRAKEKNRPAEMELSVQEGKQVKVKLTEGDGILARPVDASAKGTVPQKEIRIETVALTIDKSVTVEAPIAAESYGYTKEEEKEELAQAEVEALETPTPAPTPVAVSVPPPQPPGRRPAATRPGPPTDLVLASPKNYSEVQTDSVEVTGKLTGGRGRLMINDKRVALNEDLSFSARIAVVPGANAILIQLIRPDGSSLFRRLTVMRRENGP